MPAPGSLSGDMSINGLELTWESVMGADGYRLYSVAEGSDELPTPVSRTPIKGTSYLDKDFSLEKGDTFRITQTIKLEE